MTRTISVRAPRFDLNGVPRDWLAADPRASHVVNALSLLFPEGERFFIRSVKHYLDDVSDDADLRARVRGFFGQEGRHGHAHDALNRLLEEQGYSVNDWLAWYAKVGYEGIEPRVPAHLRLSTTAALEHMTATFAELALDSPVLDDADPRVRDLLLWHACEEIEHKSVAFDVLMRVDPRYTTRLIGFGIACGMLGLFWASALRMLLEQEPRRSAPRSEASRRFLRRVRAARPSLAKSFLAYLRPGFHPDERDNYALASKHLAAMESAESLAA